MPDLYDDSLEIQEPEPELPPEEPLEEEMLPEEPSPARETLPPKGSKEWKTYWYNKRNERFVNLESGLTGLKGELTQIKDMISQVNRPEPRVPQVPIVEDDEIAAYAKKRNVDPETLRDLADAIGKKVARQFIDPAVRPLYGNMVGQEEKELASAYKDKETGFEALRPLVDMYRQRYPSATLTNAYAMVSRPLVEEKMNKMTSGSREATTSAKSRMSDGLNRGGANPNEGEIVLAPDQRARAHETFEDEIADGKMTKADAEKKWIDSMKRIRARDMMPAPRQ